MLKPFKFKHFTITHERSAMKIGTDSVLLGAWTSIDNHPQSILDIGAGTGVLALMMAQRSVANLIDAIEIDADAYEECVDNFENSPWSDRLFCYHASLQEFNEEIDDTYDLIICNPPFFNTPLNLDTDEKEASRSKARFTESMPFDVLLKSVSYLLSDNGIFSMIIPYDQQSHIITIANNNGLYPNRILNVRGNENSDLKRSLIEFSFESINPDINELVIEIDRHVFTSDYIDLTKDFYLKM